MFITKDHIDIEASPAQIFPWLKQMGNGRAGWYSYDWIDNLGRKSLTHIEPEFQQIKVGDEIPLAKIIELEENRKITFAFGARSTFSYELEEISLGTRLYAILRVQAPSWVMALTLEPAHNFMQKKQFAEIKKRVLSFKK
jgi:hypothetical protein